MSWYVVVSCYVYIIVVVYGVDDVDAIGCVVGSVGDCDHLT